MRHIIPGFSRILRVQLNGSLAPWAAYAEATHTYKIYNYALKYVYIEGLQLPRNAASPQEPHALLKILL